MFLRFTSTSTCAKSLPFSSHKRNKSKRSDWLPPAKAGMSPFANLPGLRAARKQAMYSDLCVVLMGNVAAATVSTMWSAGVGVGVAAAVGVGVG